MKEVLTIEEQQVFGRIAIMITYQNTDILERGSFIDSTIGVCSLGMPDYNKKDDILFIRGDYKHKDHRIIIVKKEYADKIREKIKRINEKYGKECN